MNAMIDKPNLLMPSADTLRGPDERPRRHVRRQSPADMV